MPTKKKQFSMVVDDDLMESIEKYQKDNQIHNRTKAINSIISAGISALSSGEIYGGTDMPTNKPRSSIVIDQDLLDLVGQYQFSNHIKSQSRAICDLVRKGLEQSSCKSDSEESSKTVAKQDDPNNIVPRIMSIIGSKNLTVEDNAFLDFILGAAKIYFQSR